MINSTVGIGKSKYARKKAAQKAGSYHGDSPFFQNIPEFQFLKPLHKDLYPHLRMPGFKLPSEPRQDDKPSFSTRELV